MQARQLSLATVLMLCLAAPRVQAVPTPTLVKRLPLTSVAAFTDIDAPPDPDDPGIGGGIDAALFFKNTWVARLDDCTARMEKTAREWATQQGLRVVLSNSKPGDLLVHATKDELDGFFEFTYRVDAKREKARATLYFYSPSGIREEPAVIDKFLKGYAVEAFQAQFEKALNCKGEEAPRG